MAESIVVPMSDFNIADNSRASLLAGPLMALRVAGEECEDLSRHMENIKTARCELENEIKKLSDAHDAVVRCSTSVTWAACNKADLMAIENYHAMYVLEAMKKIKALHVAMIVSKQVLNVSMCFFAN